MFGSEKMIFGMNKNLFLGGGEFKKIIDFYSGK
jgi:hypothetical protein